ncbi:hypothetical protein [Vibrio phage VP4B]|uniref:Uncharacterized protein n=1 Tax=Vibrio phage VP4B TaxID=1262540 RepID=V9LZZ0_9CAUD|nr:hypothetical protein FDJ61_gp042 [Vibrio phage VP4B]AGB07156.1 hypothetical protein [Vibrio phage VP4B]
MKAQSAIIKEVMPINWKACKDGSLKEFGIFNKTDPVSGKLILLMVGDERTDSAFTLAIGGMKNGWVIRDLAQHEALGGNYKDGLLEELDGCDATTAVTKFIEILESNNL